MTSARRLLLLVLETDARVERTSTGWISRCVHCRSRLRVDEPIDSRTGATLEHIVPRSWFGEAAASELVAQLDCPDDPRNLAIACARCNHAKGMGPDARGPSDPDAMRVIRRLAATRLRQYRPPDGE